MRSSILEKCGYQGEAQGAFPSAGVDRHLLFYPQGLIRWFHFPQAALESDVSLVLVQAPCALLGSLEEKRFPE